MLGGQDHCEIHRVRTKMTPQKIAEMHRLRGQEGWTLAAIAKELGVSVMTISTHLKADGASASS
jgi:hypothetical protein